MLVLVLKVKRSPASRPLGPVTPQFHTLPFETASQPAEPLVQGFAQVAPVTQRCLPAGLALGRLPKATIVSSTLHAMSSTHACAARYSRSGRRMCVL